MTKFALAIGIALEWLFGSAVHSLPAFGHATLRTMLTTMAAWMLLEFVRLLYRAVDTLDH
jgi:hypothetical protein